MRCWCGLRGSHTIEIYALIASSSDITSDVIWRGTDVHSEVVFTYLTFSYSLGLSNEILTKENTISHVHEDHWVLVLHHLVPGLLLAAARCRVSSLSDANPPTLLVITGWKRPWQRMTSSSSLHLLCDEEDATAWGHLPHKSNPVQQDSCSSVLEEQDAAAI